jgi:hypothetical protein
MDCSRIPSGKHGVSRILKGEFVWKVASAVADVRNGGRGKKWGGRGKKRDGNRIGRKLKGERLQLKFPH